MEEAIKFIDIIALIGIPAMLAAGLTLLWEPVKALIGRKEMEEELNHKPPKNYE